MPSRAPHLLLSIVILCVSPPSFSQQSADACADVSAQKAWDDAKSPVYEDATELARSLSQRGFHVECIRRSKKETFFEGQKGAAWFKTDQGIFEVHNFDALNDILRGGFGTPEGGFRLCWVNFQRSKEVLGYPETIRWLEGRLQKCHPLNVEHFKEQLERARRGEGPTLVDMVITIIKIHGPGGDEHEDGVELELA